MYIGPKTKHGLKSVDNEHWYRWSTHNRVKLPYMWVNYCHLWVIGPSCARNSNIFFGQIASTLFAQKFPQWVHPYKNLFRIKYHHYASSVLKTYAKITLSLPKSPNNEKSSKFGEFFRISLNTPSHPPVQVCQ